MKRHFVALFSTLGLLIAATPSHAQTKIAYISLQELIPAMPEYKQASTALEEYRTALVQQAADYQQAFQQKDSIRNVDSSKWSTAMREVKRKEINELYMKWMNFSQGAEEMLGQKQQELLAPIQQKAITTAQAVGKENGYAYILSKETLIGFPPGDDLLPLVAKKLNLTLPNSKAAPPAEKKPAGK